MAAVADLFRLIRSQRTFRGILVLNVLLGLAYSFSQPFLSMFGTLEVGMSKLSFGVFMILTTGAGIVASTALARYSDTLLSRRTVLLLGGVAGALGYGGYAHFRAFLPLVLVGAFVLGFSTVCFSQVFAYAREVLTEAEIPPAQFAFFMNAFRMFFGLSWMVGPALASWIKVRTSYSGLFVSVSGLFVLFCIGVVLWVPDTSRVTSARAARQAGGLLSVLGRADLVAHLIAFSLVMAANTMATVAFPLLIVETLRGTDVDVGIAYSIGPIFEVPCMLYFGWLATRRAPGVVLRLGVVIAITYFSSLAFAHHLWQVYALQCLSAAMMAVLSGTSITYFQEYLPDHPGTATNLYTTVQRVGSMAGFFLFGLVAQRVGYRQLFGLCAAFACAGLLLLKVPIRAAHPGPMGQDR